jgi:hypothetical protein
VNQREAWSEPDGRVRLVLPTADGGTIDLNMSAAQAEQCCTDLFGAILSAQEQSPER